MLFYLTCADLSQARLAHIHICQLEELSKRQAEMTEMLFALPPEVQLCVLEQLDLSDIQTLEHAASATGPLLQAYKSSTRKALLRRHRYVSELFTYEMYVSEVGCSEPVHSMDGYIEYLAFNGAVANSIAIYLESIIWPERADAATVARPLETAVMLLRLYGEMRTMLRAEDYLICRKSQARRTALLACLLAIAQAVLDRCHPAFPTNMPEDVKAELAASGLLCYTIIPPIIGCLERMFTTASSALQEDCDRDQTQKALREYCPLTYEPLHDRVERMMAESLWIPDTHELALPSVGLGVRFTGRAGDGSMARWLYVYNEEHGMASTGPSSWCSCPRLFIMESRSSGGLTSRGILSNGRRRAGRWSFVRHKTLEAQDRDVGSHGCGFKLEPVRLLDVPVA